MMYFCPCPCNSAIDPELEESTFLALPRNLSYVQESYLDRHSVSGRFVHNPKADIAQELKDRRSYQGNNDDDDELEGYHVDACETEKLELLNAVRSELPECCEAPFSSAEFQPKSSSVIRRGASSPVPVTTSPQTGAKVRSPDDVGEALAPPGGTGSFLVSRLASFLSSPKEEPSSFSGDYDKDFSSSVDQLPPQASEIPRSEPEPEPVTPPPPPSPAPVSQFEVPDSRGLTMDRGEGNVNDSSCQAARAEETTMTSTSTPGTSSPCPPPAPVEIPTLFPIPGNQTGNADEIDVLLEGMKDPNPSPADEKLGGKSDGTKGKGEIWQSSGKTPYPKKTTTITLDTSHPHRHNLTGEDDDAESESNIRRGQTTTSNCHESPDSDAFSEEGVFVNMMDDLDTNDKSTTVSEVSDDTCVSVDSMFLSPDEEELEDDNSSKTKEQSEQSHEPRMTVEEAISRAASDLSKMSMMMYPDSEDSPSTEASHVQADCKWKLTRASPLRQCSDLTIHLSYENLSPNHNLSRNDLELPESPVYEEHEFNFNKKTLRKSSSLKTNKTPPGTPHRKKVVRFADAMGLDLESVRHVLNMESPPRIPPSAMADLRQGLGEDRKDVGPRFLCPCFTQPGAQEGFVGRVLEQKVCLENAIITDLTITGFVRVANISYHKSVRVRYTHNNWATFHDIAASYVLNSCDGPTDRFSFSIVAPAYFSAGSRLEFALSFSTEDGSEYWDSNKGHNYSFECFAKPVPTDNEMSWMHFI